MYRKICFKISIPLMFPVLLIKKETSKAKAKRKTDTGSSCWVPFSKLKYGVVLPLSITQDC